MEATVRSSYLALDFFEWIEGKKREKEQKGGRSEEYFIPESSAASTTSLGTSPAL